MVGHLPKKNASGNPKSAISGQGLLLLDPKSAISGQAYSHFQASKSPIFRTEIWGSFQGPAQTSPSFLIGIGDNHIK